MRVEIPQKEVTFFFARGTGKGGQKRNKTSTKAILEFDVEGSNTLSDTQKVIVLRDSNRVTADGHIIIASDETRSQRLNKRFALEVLNNHLSRLLTPRKKRKPTKKPKAVKAREKESHKKQQKKKAERRTRYV